jgi:DNA (cytosine-5)-methyltransferase 1
MKDSKPRVLDLFAGCGGLSLGLERAGFNIAWANEIDSDACESYSSVHHKTEIFNEDINIFIKKVIAEEKFCPQVGEVDLLVGGPPCQGFSGYNRYSNPSDPRNSLVESYLSFVQVIKPKFLLMENVPGMLKMEDGKVVRLISDALESIGYQTKLGILQCGNFGIPQNRWRVFIFGSKKSLTIPEFPTPTHKFPRTTLFGAKSFRENVIKLATEDEDLFLPKPSKNLTVYDAISDLPATLNGCKDEEYDYTNSKISRFQKMMREGSKKITDHIATNLGPVMFSRVSAVPKKPGAGWLDLPEELKPKNLSKHGDKRYENRFGRLWWEGIFNTVVSKPEPYWGRVIHPTQDRVITVREAARAQSLPDRLQFNGKLSSKYKQVGNAVPPIIAERIGLEIMKVINSTNGKTTK